MRPHGTWLGRRTESGIVLATWRMKEARLPVLTMQDHRDIKLAREQYEDSRACAIHMSIDHVKNLLRVVDKLLDAQTASK